MIVTVYEGFDNSHILLDSKDRRFLKEYGGSIKAPNGRVYRVMAALASWVNNELGEECLFEVD